MNRLYIRQCWRRLPVVFMCESDCTNRWRARKPFRTLFADSASVGNDRAARSCVAPSRSRQGRYHVSDQFLRFYYRFIVPHRTAIERGEIQGAVKKISEDLRAFIGTYVFEELCREWVFYESDRGGLGFLPEQVGGFWTQRRGQAVQLDIVAASRREKHLLIGEAKWGEKPVAREVLTDLVLRSQRMPQVALGWSTQYALFARTGFTEATQEMARELKVRLVDLEGLERALTLRSNAIESE